MTKKLLLMLAVSAAAFTATPALAHSGAGAATGFAAGLAHPVLGLGQWLAMLAIGIGLGLVTGDWRRGQVWPALFAAGIGSVTIFALLHGHIHALEAVAALAAYFAGYTLAPRIPNAIGSVPGQQLVLSSIATQALGTFVALAGGAMLAL